ncbi:hypothetical protein ACIQAC_05780 [Streptomyces sp. NPDC088387]|uniref:hypothetical protein n=1 Tax=Streptomyces sp. NPDC088387 TaxID=3365859 RepID=UPI003807D7A3
MSACAVCGGPTAPTGRGRPPVYCSRACQAKAYRARKRGALPRPRAVVPVPEPTAPAPRARLLDAAEEVLLGEGEPGAGPAGTGPRPLPPPPGPPAEVTKGVRARRPELSE